jgi:hypothetical protein
VENTLFSKQASAVNQQTKKKNPDLHQNFCACTRLNRLLLSLSHLGVGEEKKVMCRGGIAELLLLE